MATIVWTRDARCKDCENLKYYYVGKRKLHKCIKNNCQETLEDSAGSCIDNGDFVFNPTSMPDRLNQIKFAN